MSKACTTPDLVELVRGLFESGNRRDFEAILGFFAPDAVWEAVNLGTNFKGGSAIRGFLEDWLGAYEEYEIEPEEIVDLGNGVVFAGVRLTGRPVGSTGGVLVRRRPLVFVWAGGLVARVTTPSSGIDEARATAERLAALGE